MDPIGAGRGPWSDRETVVFRLGDATYGIDIERVSKLLRMKEITPCAREGSMVSGVVNIKGRTIPVYDLAAVLDCHRTKETAKSRIIVTEGDHGPAAFVVDAVTSVVSRHGGKLREATARAVVSMEGSSPAIVDIDAALASKNLI